MLAGFIPPNRDHLLSRTEMVAQRSEYSTANKSKECGRETESGRGDIRRVAGRQEQRRAGPQGETTTFLTGVSFFGKHLWTTAA